MSLVGLVRPRRLMMRCSFRLPPRCMTQTRLLAQQLHERCSSLSLRGCARPASGRAHWRSFCNSATAIANFTRMSAPGLHRCWAHRLPTAPLRSFSPVSNGLRRNALGMYSSHPFALWATWATNRRFHIDTSPGCEHCFLVKPISP